MLALPVWPTRPDPKPTYPYGPTRPTWPSPCGPHGYTQATTLPCPAHGHTLVHHTIVSCTRPSTRVTTCPCDVDGKQFRLSLKLLFLQFGNTPGINLMQNHSRAFQNLKLEYPIAI
ncbi:hypothetical protein J1N35_026515 [Gossypium stocksii]|uniref:Uncharacterized protein n=1 Tax=Gossypium stocksii TaxID=47602 RepID=A0A9D3V859_9ROSI|nr:hypothetical protein J1N35_026515 [Gossypium stocksii]